MTSYHLRQVKEQDLELILKWRNSDRIRKNMFTDRFITWDEHLQWYRSSLNSNKSNHQIFMLNDKPTGLMSYSDINHLHGTCFWGFYIGDELAPKGLGTIMGELGIEYAFENLNIRKINGEVLSHNERSIRFHERLGFIREGYFTDHIFKDSIYVDVIRYALFKEKWIVDKR